MADLGVDFSFSKFTAAQLKAAGFTFAARYLASSSGKRLTAAEVADFRANDIGIVLVWEDEATAALEGFNRGQHDAQVATQQATALGIPANIPIYLAVDFDINDAQKPIAGEYFKGAESVSPRFRAGYGGYYLIKYLFDNGLIDYGWQAVAWSGGQVDPRVHIYQNGQSAFGGGADVDEARQTNFGQWGTMEVEMISDQNHLTLLFQQFLGRNPTDTEVMEYVGKMSYTQMIDIMINQDGYKNTARLYQIGLIADRDNWFGQIENLQKQETTAPAPAPATNPNTDPAKPLPQLTNNVPVKGEVIPVTVHPTVPKKTIWQALADFWHTLVG